MPAKCLLKLPKRDRIGTAACSRCQVGCGMARTEQHSDHGRGRIERARLQGLRGAKPLGGRNRHQMGHCDLMCQLGTIEVSVQDQCARLDDGRAVRGGIRGTHERGLVVRQMPQRMAAGPGNDGQRRHQSDHHGRHQLPPDAPPVKDLSDLDIA